MFEWYAYGMSVASVLVIASCFWVVSLVRNDVSIVDALWSLMFLVILGMYITMTGSEGPRVWLLLALVTIWAIRLSAFISVRNHGQPEDHRYQTIRQNNQPNFRFKSLYLVFGLQALLAGIIAIPLAAGASANTALGLLDYVGVALWCIGMFFEAVGDHQLSAFRADPTNKGKVLNTGLWAYTRHPNYFGEFTLWWGYFCIALAAGGWWTVFAPLLMSFLLLRVSGVSLLESTIKERRPKYAEYIEQTNAFFPGLPRLGKSAQKDLGSGQ